MLCLEISLISISSGISSALFSSLFFQHLRLCHVPPRSPRQIGRTNIHQKTPLQDILGLLRRQWEKTDSNLIMLQAKDETKPLTPKNTLTDFQCCDCGMFAAHSRLQTIPSWILSESASVSLVQPFSQRSSWQWPANISNMSDWVDAKIQEAFWNDGRLWGRPTISLTLKMGGWKSRPSQISGPLGAQKDVLQLFGLDCLVQETCGGYCVLQATWILPTQPYLTASSSSPRIIYEWMWKGNMWIIKKENIYDHKWLPHPRES